MNDRERVLGSDSKNGRSTLDSDDHPRTPLTIKQKIVFVWQHGGPRDPNKPDELKAWIESYFPGEYKGETIFRRARELREAGYF